MHNQFRLMLTMSVVVCAIAVGLSERAVQRIELDDDDIGGVVSSADGPEAGVWVVAETTDFATRFIRIVATDDQGRYVLMLRRSYVHHKQNQQRAVPAVAHLTPGPCAV